MSIDAERLVAAIDDYKAADGVHTNRLSYVLERDDARRVAEAAKGVTERDAERFYRVRDSNAWAVAAAALIEAQAAEIATLKTERDDLRTTAIAFCGSAAVEYARTAGLPDGHLYPAHYDILAAAGARMTDFVRAALPSPPTTEDGR